MNHCRAVRVPIMMIRGPSPFHRPEEEIRSLLEWFSVLREEKKMAAVHFTTILSEPYTARKVQYAIFLQYLSNICPCANDIVYARFEDFRTFLHVFISVVKDFVR